MIRGIGERINEIKNSFRKAALPFGRQTLVSKLWPLTRPRESRIPRTSRLGVECRSGCLQLD